MKFICNIFERYFLTRNNFSMDKYTVDLDKLLNDFEYNELTDNQDTTSKVSEISNQNTKLNNALPSSSINQRNTNTKHSITNVFHSLNEYLNTDISCKPKFDDKVLINTVVHNDLKLVNAPVNNEVITTNLNNVIVKNNTTIPEKNVNSIILPDVETSAIDNVEEINALDLDNDVEKESIVNGTDYPNCNQVILIDNFMNNDENSINPESDEMHPDNEQAVSEDESTSHSDCIESNAIDTNINLSVVSNEVVSAENDAPRPDDYDEMNLIAIENDKDEQNAEIEAPIKDLDENTTCTDDLQPVTFDTIEIDDVELNKYLEEIENEFENQKETSPNDNQEPIVVNNNTESSSEPVVTITKPENEQIIESHSKEIVEVELTNNAEEEIEEQEQNIEDSTTITGTVEENVNANETVIEEAKLVVNLNNGDRPTSLELEMDDNKREIDLIGEISF